MNSEQKLTQEAQKLWHHKIYRYIEDEIYLDDLERVVMKYRSDFNDQLSMVNFILHGDLLVNNLMVELGDTSQIHYYLFEELNSFDKNNEILSIFYVASGFKKAIIESVGRDSSSTKVSNSIALMKKWCVYASDIDRFKTIILNRLIDRVLQSPIEEDSNYLMANKYANHVVYTGSEELRKS